MSKSNSPFRSPSPSSASLCFLSVNWCCAVLVSTLLICWSLECPGGVMEGVEGLLKKSTFVEGREEEHQVQS